MGITTEPEATYSDEDVRAVVLTGAGEDFCVGADLGGGGFDVNDESSALDDWQEPAGRCTRRVFAMNTPVIAAMRGAAVGAGTTITLACDFEQDLPPWLPWREDGQRANFSHEHD